MDRIKIENLEVFAHHGVYEEEQKNGQNFYVNAELFTQVRAAGLQDSLALSTNYGEVCHFIHQFMKEHTWQLIESVAERLAEALLLTFERVEAVKLEIRKPSAPIGLPFESVSVSIERGWHTAFVALGSNLGEREKYIQDALTGIREHKLIQMEAVSDIICTKPYGGVEQDDFLNGVVMLKTLLSPDELLGFLQELEQKAERKREIHWGPRTLDLDIIFYDNLVLCTKDLLIPHPDMHNRIFVLEPICQIAPWYRHPLLHKTMQELLNGLR
ncbi:MAG: 2-amino-4-hydroxy-6-hydroxymethyldihydropteridine diphosphokinase [Clostridiales bacterium]|nr:2-amino-4-hydroxy-6-hydroxymethyldihydropteridine diphosphokinase [Clostridiales bacterium]